MAALSKLGGELKLSVLALLRGCGQLAFCDSPWSGGLVLAGVALIAPFSALGMLLGAAFGTLAGRFGLGYRQDEWASGLAGFNPAIVGLLWGGFLASGELPVAFLLPALALSMLLDVAFKRALARLQLPALSIGAFTTVYLVSMAAAPPGGWFWTDAPIQPLIPFAVAGAACMAVAMLMQSPFAACWALLLAVLVLIVGWLGGHDPQGLAALCALTVPLASFGVHAVFLRGAFSGCVVGTVAAALAASIWIAWQSSVLAQWMPPLLMPFILGVWLSIVLVRPLSTSPLTQPAFWRVVAILGTRSAGDRQTVALVGNVSDTGLVASSFFIGAWRDPQMLREDWSVDDLHASPRIRQRFWEACERLRMDAACGQAGRMAAGLAKLQRDGWLGAIAMQDIAAQFPTVASGEIVFLHGHIQETVCMDCKASRQWPPARVWRHCDLRCGCQGPLVPNITPFGARLTEAAQNRLVELAAHCSAVLVVGEEACEPATAAFLEHARRRGAPVVFLSDGPKRYPRREADLSVHAPAAACLGLLYIALRVWGLAAHPGIRGLARRSARLMRRADKGVAG